MNKISKILKKLSEKERKLVKVILTKIVRKDFRGMNLKKLRGESNIFRIRKSALRIIYRTGDEGSIFILAIERRSERTYKRFG